MGEVLAVLEAAGPGPVMTSTAALAQLLAARTARYEVPDATAEEQVDDLLRHLERTHPEAAVMGLAGADSLCWQVVGRVGTPILVVPRRHRTLRKRFREVLLPLDDTPDSARAVAPVVGRLTDAGAVVRVVHVFDQRTVPAFWDQAAHSGEHWGTEFLRRNATHAGHVDLLRGRPGEQIVDEARRSNADLIVLGWSQDLSAERAKTIRECLTEGVTPVLLVPVGSGPSLPQP